MVQNAYTIYRQEAGKKDETFFRMTALSVAAHCVVIVVIVLVSNIGWSRPLPMEVIPVDLVNLPVGEGSAPGEVKEKPATAPKPDRLAAPEPPAPPPSKKAKPVKAEAPKPAPKEVAEPEAEPEPAESTVLPNPEAAPPLPKAKKSAKKTSYNAEKALHEVIRDIEKNVDAEQPDTVKGAIADMRRRLGAGETAAVETGVKSDGGGYGGAGGLGKTPSLQVMQLYNIQLQMHVHKNWSCPDQFIGTGEKPSARMMLTITRDGGIRDSMFDQRSGNPYFDDSVRRAVEKANPVPPIPKDWEGDTYTVVINFTPPT
jgi:TonB family protein